MYKNGKPNYNECIFTKEQEKDIVDSYLNGESSVSIGKRYNTSHKPILKILHKKNIKIDRALSTRKYSINENYFDVIDTANKAYIIGFLSADGCNYSIKSTISMSLEECDKEILEKIRIEMGNDHPLEYVDYSNKNDFGYTYKNQYRMLIFSKHMCDCLTKIGVTPSKSNTLYFSPYIPKEFYADYIRGIFDGDGSLGVKNINTYAGSLNISITSTFQMCNSIQDILNIYNIDSYVKEASNKNGITAALNITKKDSQKKFLEWIYDNADLYLKRKHDIYLLHYNLIQMDNSLIA